MGMRRRAGRAFQRARAAIPLSADCICVACGRRIGAFLRYRGGEAHRPPLMRALEIVGSNVDQFECPRCGAHDRERHLLLYMRASGILRGLTGSNVLHIAPELHIAQLIRAARPYSYIEGDLFPQTENALRIDLTALAFEDESFDLVIANHVLEHVHDDGRALAEIYRVLRPGAYAILQTPYSRKLRHTWSDCGIDTDHARRQAYGQEDHVRLFGSDIFERFCSAGLEPHVSTHQQLLRDIDPRRFGVNEREPFFLFRRPTGSSVREA